MATKKNITQSGPQSYRDLQKANAEAYQKAALVSPLASIGQQRSYAPSTDMIYEGYEASPIQQSGMGYWGDSMFDEPSVNEEDYQNNLQDIRADNQPWYAKLGAGLAKGAALAGTTFLDGTVGLLAGIGTAIAEGRISGIWDNEVSNSLSELNRELENVLPNYRTREEEERPWYQNLATINFWADSVIKNLGFTVGAFYSGGAWTKALKGIGWLKGALGAKAVGSTLSAVNEGRIEANNNAHDFLEVQNAEINDAIDKRREEIIASDFLSSEEKEVALSNLDKDAQVLLADAQDRADRMGLTTLIGNTVLLSLDNYAQFGKLYARGFKNAKGLRSGITKAAEEQAIEEAGKNVIKQEGKYAWKDITKKQAFMKGVKNGLLEGNEELAQAFIAETAGNMQSPDSPDAYYDALTDHNAQIQTKDFLTSVTEGFVNTYGNSDRWEEFAVGAFTGLLGMPTFGKVNNSDANTYLGRGKSIGLSGGLFGEISNANQQNREGREAVEVMNKYVNKLQNHARYFAQSQSFTNAMDGWADADDAFEYKNAEDNDDFAAISRFAQTGKLADLKELVNQDFENISDEELQDIALNTSPNVSIGEDETVETSNSDGSPQRGGWRTTDGHLMSETEEGRQQMREELIKKRDKILSEIDKYEDSVETVRAIGNNSLTEDQVNELAWLNWKVGMFTDRYNSIKEENRDVLGSIRRGIQAFQNGRGQGMIDQESKEGQQIITAMNNAGEFIDLLQDTDSPLKLGALIEANPHLVDFMEELAYPIIEDMSGVDAATFEKAMTDLRDTARIAQASRTFNQRYKEFKSDPIKLIKNREKIDKKKEKVNKVAEDVNLKDKVNNSNVSDIVKGMESGDLDSGELDGLFSEEDNEFLNNEVKTQKEGEPDTPTGKEKVEEAKKIIKTSGRMDEAIDNLDDSSIDPQALADAHTLLKNSKSVSESEQEMLDTASQAYNDPTLLYDENDPSMQNVSQEELESILSDRIDAAKSVIEQAKATLNAQNDELDDLPENAPVKKHLGDEEVKATQPEKETGHDATSKTPTENERQKQEKEEQKQKEVTDEERGKINEFFSGLKDEIPQGSEETFNKAVKEILNGIDMLIDAKATSKQIGDTIKGTQSYKIAKQLAPSLDDYLNVYVTSRTKPKTESTTKESAEPRVTTPSVTEDEVKQATTAQMNSNPNQAELTGTYQFWKPTLSYLPFGEAYVKGNTTPFYKLARGMKNKNGAPKYTEAQLRRIEAVGKYLDEHGAFKLIDNDGVKVGDEIHFVIDSALNDAAGELVILMADKQGRVLGDVMSPNDYTFNRQLGLSQFVERVTKEYEDAGSPQHFTSKEITTVDKNMAGKPPYLADHQVMHTLNEVHSDGTNPIPFKIGVAVNSGQNARILATAGRTKKQGQSDLERSINPPLTAKAGQPFLLVPTSSSVNHYTPVPFVMDAYSPTTQGTALGKAVHKVLERIPNSDNSGAISIINALEELISVQEVHINYDGDNVKITIKPNGAEHQMTIYNGAKNAPNIVEQLELGLQGQPFQISRKYINEDYEGQDYNRMIGEIARVNLPIGATHTIGDWFTIKPVNAQGKQMKTKSPRSTGKNPNAAQVPTITINYKGTPLEVNTKTWEVSDGKKTYSGERANLVKAQAFGIFTNQNMEQPYQTEWGYYDPKKNAFVEKPNIVRRGFDVPQSSEEEAVRVIRTGISIIGEALAESVGRDASAIREQDINNWLKSSQVAQIMRQYAKGAKSVEDVINAALADNPSKQLADTLNDILRFDSSRSIIQSYITPEEQQTETPEQLEDKAKKAGLLGNKVRQALWQVLTPEQQAIIVNKKGPKQKQWMDALEGAFNTTTDTFDEAKLKGSVDTFLGRKGLYRKTDGSQRVWNRQKELKWLSKALPNLSNSEHLKVLEGVERIATEDGGYAYGQFKKGVITIADKAARGTVYHEAFHAVTHTLLNPQEYKELFNAAKEKWGNISNLALEENLAEDFRRYVQLEETPVIGKAVKIYRTLKHLVQSLFGKEPYLNKLYYSISRGRLSDRTPNKSSSTRYRTDTYEIQKQIDTLKKHYRLAEKHVNSARSTDRAVIDNIISGTGLSDVLFSYQQNGNGKWSIARISKTTFDNRLKTLQDRLAKVYESELSEDEKLSRQMLEEQEESYYRRIEQHHRDKMMYNNLSQEDKDYLTEKGITPQEFTQMTQLEKEVLFQCKY